MPPMGAKKQLVIPKTKEDIAREGVPAKTPESAAPDRPATGSKPPVEPPASASRPLGSAAGQAQYRQAGGNQEGQRRARGARR